MGTNAMYDKVIGIIDQDRQDLIDLCMLLGNTQDYAGDLMPCAEAVVEWFTQSGIDAYIQPITETSANAIGVLPGASDGTNLILNAHMDAGRPLPADAGEKERRMQGSWLEGEMLYGSGLINDKAQLCAEMIAARAIKKARVRLRGNLTVIGVDYETGEPSVDGKQGIKYPGEGFGTKWSVDRGVIADYALVGETSNFGVVAAECGKVFLKIKVKGRWINVPRLERGSTLQENPNPNVKASYVVQALEEWAVNYERENTQKFFAGTFVPKAGIRDYVSSRDNSYIYLDIRTVPGTKPNDLLRQVKEATRKTGVDCDVTIYEYQRGRIAERAEPLIDAVKEAHRYVLGTEPGEPPSQETSMWRDVNAYNEAGIPSVCYGAPRQREFMSSTGNRAMLIGDLVTATKVYALTAMGLCGIAEG